MRYTGYNAELVKQQNRKNILSLIYEKGPVSRIDISRQIGLTQAAVTLISAQLIKENILRETGTAEAPGAGRKKILLDINPDFRHVLSVNIEPEKTWTALCDMKGNALKCAVCATEADSPEEYLKKTAVQCRRLEEETGIRADGISVGITGIVNRQTGESLKAYGVFDRPADVRKILEAETGLPVSVENNINAFAEAEAMFGYGRTFDNLMIIKWGPGVGSALIIDGKLYEGRHQRAGELGHSIVEKNGRLCTCGRRGCLETKVSRRALNEIVPFESEAFADVFEESEGRTRQRLQEAVDLFARAIVNAATVMAPNRIVLCGSLFSDERIRRRVIEACRAYDHGFSDERILYTELHEKQGFIGPAAVYISNILYGKI
ncbi:MAG: ROK family protein [Solobacterium sp.]|nr:ROK family protein [Solobacterium sp.]